MNEQNVPGRTKERGGGATHNRVTEEHAKNKMDAKRPLDGKLLSSAFSFPSSSSKRPIEKCATAKNTQQQQ